MYFRERFSQITDFSAMSVSKRKKEALLRKKWCEKNGKADVSKVHLG